VRLNIAIFVAKSALVIRDSSGADSMRLTSTSSVGASSSSIFILIMIIAEGGRSEARRPVSDLDRNRLPRPRLPHKKREKTENTLSN